MTIDEDLADRVRALIEGHATATERRMFGGVSFMVGGNVACGVLPRGLLVRCAADEAAAYLEEPFASQFEMGGRASLGWLLIDAEGLDDDAVLGRWVDVGVAFASSLPAKG